MPFTGVDKLDHSIDTCNRWLDDIATEIGTEDRRVAYRALRGWLHTLRDRLTVQTGAHFAAQLPELFRGVYYDGWSPSHVPVKMDRTRFLTAFGDSSAIRGQAAGPALASVTRCMRRHLGRGALDHAFDQLPKDVRSLLDAPAKTDTGATSSPKTAKTGQTTESGQPIAAQPYGEPGFVYDTENEAW
jgi:uncharacterized protein (DUF2267 family)